MAYISETIEVSRSFIKKMMDKSTWFGTVHAPTTLRIHNGVWFLDGKELPKVSREYLMVFALQSLQDAYAGAEDLDDAQARFEKKYTRLIAGEIGTREASGATSDETDAQRHVARRIFFAQFAKGSDEYKAYKAADTKGRFAILDDVAEQMLDDEDFQREVADRIAAVETERAADLAMRERLAAKKIVFKL
jgi:hypothetical protein